MHYQLHTYQVLLRKRNRAKSWLIRLNEIIPLVGDCLHAKCRRLSLLLLLVRLITILNVNPLLDPFVHFFLMVEQHLREAGLGRLQEVAVSFGRFAPGIGSAPDAVRVGNKNEGVLVELALISSWVIWAGRYDAGDLRLCTISIARFGCARRSLGRGFRRQRI